jgi:solute carrier family 25 (mitochondrial iron transporter), member 28/37
MVFLNNVAAAGAMATIAHDGFMTPFDVVKQRLQINSRYKSMFHCASSVYQAEGLRAFYISFPVTLMMSMPFQILQFTTYEHVRKKLNPSGEYNPLSHIVAGGLAGAIASSTTNPLDVAKTLLQTRGQASDSALRHASGLVQTFKLIYEREGPMGFTRGMRARVASHIPATAVAWTTVIIINAV